MKSPSKIRFRNSKIQGRANVRKVMSRSVKAWGFWKEMSVEEVYLISTYKKYIGYTGRTSLNASCNVRNLREGAFFFHLD